MVGMSNGSERRRAVFQRNLSSYLDFAAPVNYN